MDKVPLTAAVVVVPPQLNPTLPIDQGENKTTTKRRRRTKNHKTYDNKLGKRYLSNVNEDILLEIFLRLPNSRSAIQCTSVCRGWLQLISQPQFIPRFIQTHRDDHCYTILYRRRYYYIFKPQEYYQVVCKLFSNESWLLHGKPPSSSNYLDFMPELCMTVRASCKDLFLVSPDSRYSPMPKLYICNPVTKKWSLVPGVPPDGNRIGFALICHQHQYKVVIIYRPAPFDYTYGTRVVVLSAKSGQWSNSDLWFPSRDTRDYSHALEVVACNGILYWMDSFKHLDRIIALDLFNGSAGDSFVLDHPPWPTVVPS